MITLLATAALAQSITLPAASPHASVSQQIGVVDVTVDWSSPAVKGRNVWGELVPYDKLWRTGANAATKLATTGEITIGGAKIPAGTYALFTIPGKDQWTVIVNRNAEQSNVNQYDQALDVVRVQVKPVEAPPRERLTFVFSDTTEKGATLDLEWAGLRVGVPITVDTAGMVTARIERYATDTADGLADAARYKAENGDLAGARELIDASVAIDETWYNVWLKADILHQQGDNRGAYPLAQRAMELGTAAGDGFFWKSRVEKALAEWKKK